MADLLIKSLQRAIRGDASEIESFVASFVRIRSENPPGKHYGDCCDFLCERMRKYGLEPAIHHLTSSGGETSAVQAFVGSEGPVVYFHGHYDVVPASSESQFVPEITSILN